MFITKTTRTAAFWISPEDEIIGVGTSHISKIIDNPERFDLTLDYIRAIYKNYNEPLGFEGKARDIIVRKIISRGWIRLRRYPNKCWKINLADLSKQAYETLNLWAEQMLSSGVAGFIEGDGYLPVIIIHPDGHFEYRTTMNDLAHNWTIQNEKLKEFAS